MGAEAFEVVCDNRDRDRWLRERRKLLTASDVPAVLGLSPWKPAIQVYAEKTTAWEEGPEHISEAMEIGNEIEPWLLAALSKRIRCEVKPAGLLLRSKRWPWLGATLDGTVVGRKDTPLRAYAGRTGTVEVKGIGGAFADDWISTVDDTNGTLPEHYRPQVVTQLAVTGSPFAVFGGLLGGRGFRFRFSVVEADEREIKQLVEKTEAWWADHVEADVPPDPDGSERAGEIMESLWPGASGRVPLDDEAERIVSKLLAIRHETKALDAEDRKLRQLLSRMIREGSPPGEPGEPVDATGVLPDGREVKLRTEERAGHVVKPSRYEVLRLPKTGF